MKAKPCAGSTIIYIYIYACVLDHHVFLCTFIDSFVTVSVDGVCHTPGHMCDLGRVYLYLAVFTPKCVLCFNPVAMHGVN